MTCVALLLSQTRQPGGSASPATASARHPRGPPSTTPAAPSLLTTQRSQTPPPLILPRQQPRRDAHSLFGTPGWALPTTQTTPGDQVWGRGDRAGAQATGQVSEGGLLCSGGVPRPAPRLESLRITEPQSWRPLQLPQTSPPSMDVEAQTWARGSHWAPGLPVPSLSTCVGSWDLDRSTPNGFHECSLQLTPH